MPKKIKPGTLLLSEPFMNDDSFKRAVVLICDHSPEDGSIGFILNKPSASTIRDLIADFPEIDATVYYGGPVGSNTIHYIHNVGHILDDSVEVSRGIYWGGDFDKLKFLIKNELVKPDNIKFFVGYSGWSSQQLEDELEYGSWVTSEIDPNYVFKARAEELWGLAMRNLGDTFEVIAQLPDNPILN